MSVIVPEEIDSIAGGYHGDPFRILGPHESETGWEIRAFLPQAREASVMTLEGSVPMRRLHEAGFFVASFTARPRTYMFNVKRTDGGTQLVEDPYRFSPHITSFWP